MRSRRMVFPEGWLLLVNSYLSEKKQRCLTYRGLRTWLFRKPEYRDIEWHTVERNLRKLAEHGYLDRVELESGDMLFCINTNAKKLLRTLLESIYGNEMFR